MLTSFLIFLGFFLLIGVFSFVKSRGTKEDYYLASQSVSPWLVGLSSVATNNSGYMFIGVIGYTYSTGLASIWLMIGWILGDYIASMFVHKRLRKATDSQTGVTFAGSIANWSDVPMPNVQKLIALISFVFLLAYAAAQLVAGSKALNVLLGWPQWAGAVLGACLVGAYCLAGGIRASIWTDAAQSFVMIFTMGLLLVVSFTALGGYQSVVFEMSKVDGFLLWFPQDLLVPGFFGMMLFILAWMFAGFSVVGQPHIMVRFMALSETSKMTQARIWYYTWFILFYCAATAVGLLSRIYLNNPAEFDAELALPTMALELLPPYLVGLMLAGIFAATMSTADSLILSCSSALSHDLSPSALENPWSIRLVTIAVTVLALLWALSNKQSVFSLVIMAWSGLGSAFVPLILALCLKWQPNSIQSIGSMVVGLSVAILWRVFDLHAYIYEGLPGIICGFLILLIWGNKQKQIEQSS